MYGYKVVSLSAQRGITVTGLIVVLGLLAMVAMLGMKVFPVVLEYRAAKAAIVTARSAEGGTHQKRMAFARAADMNSISTVKAKDLIIYKINGQDHVAFDYETKVELFKDVSLLLHFDSTTDPTGVIPERTPEVLK